MTRSDSVTLRELKSLIGKLQFATSTIRGGRCFLRRLHDATIGKTSPFHKVVLTAETKQDLALWEDFLKNHNGVEITQTPTHFAHSICSDASLTGYGGTYKNSYIQGCFPPSWARHPIHILELFPIYLLIHIFQSAFRNSSLRVQCDNHAIVHTLNKLTSKDPKTMTILRKITLLLLKNNITLHAVHLPGKANTLCDALSRQVAHGEMLRRHHMDALPTSVPSSLRPHNWEL